VIFNNSKQKIIWSEVPEDHQRVNTLYFLTILQKNMNKIKKMLEVSKTWMI